MDTDNRGDNPPQNNDKNLFDKILFWGQAALNAIFVGVNHFAPAYDIPDDILQFLQTAWLILLVCVILLIFRALFYRYKKGYFSSINCCSFIFLAIFAIVTFTTFTLDTLEQKNSKQEALLAQEQAEAEEKIARTAEREISNRLNVSYIALNAVRAEYLKKEKELFSVQASYFRSQQDLSAVRAEYLQSELKLNAVREEQIKDHKELMKEQQRALQLETTGKESRQYIVTQNSNEILRRVRGQATEFDPKPENKFYTYVENDLFNVYYQSDCGSYQPVFNIKNDVESEYLEKTIVELNAVEVIAKTNAPSKESLDDKTVSRSEITWYQLTPRGVYNADEAIKAMQELWPCDPMSENKEGELAAIEQQLLINICEGGVDVDGEYRFSVNGAEGRLKVYVYNHFQKRYLPYVQRGGTPVDLKLVVARLLVRGDIRKSEITNGDETTAWYVLTSQGLEKVRKLFPLSDTCENCKVEEKQEKTAPRKSTNLPAIPPETVPTPSAKPSV